MEANTSLPLRERIRSWFRAISMRRVLVPVLVVVAVAALVGGFLYWNSYTEEEDANTSPAPKIEPIEPPTPSPVKLTPAPHKVPVVVVPAPVIPTTAPAPAPVSVHAEHPRIVGDCLAGNEVEAYRCCGRLEVGQMTICRQAVRDLTRQ